MPMVAARSMVAAFASGVTACRIDWRNGRTADRPDASGAVDVRHGRHGLPDRLARRSLTLAGIGADGCAARSMVADGLPESGGAACPAV